MTTLEQLIRDTLAEHADDAPPASVLSPPGHHRRRWPYAIAAAVLVAGLAVGLAVTRPDKHEPARPAGPTKTISYRGLTLDVPAHLTVYGPYLCSPPVDGVVLAGSLYLYSISCMPGGVPANTQRNLLILSTDGRSMIDEDTAADPQANLEPLPIVVAGHRVRVAVYRDPDGGVDATVALPGGVTLAAVVPSRAELEAVLRSVRVVPGAHAPCESLPRPAQPVGPFPC